MNVKYLAGIAAAMIAAPQFASAQGGSPADITSVTNFTTFFNELDGMKVSWTTSGASCDAGCSGTWGQIGSSQNWGVIGADFSLTAKGSLDTYGIGALGYRWNLSGTDVTSFTIDPTYASAAFDVTNFPTGTPGSSFGNKFQISGCFIGLCFDGDTWGTTATYTGPVSLNGTNYGDLYDLLTVNFNTAFGSTSFHNVPLNTALFTQDVDLVDYDAGISGPQGSDVTPEPTTMTLLATGLIGMAGMVRRRRRKV